MQVRSHIVVGVITTSTAAAYVTGAGLSPLALFAAIAGSLAPDIDTPHSWLGRRLPFISWPLAAVIGHRGLTHSLAMVIALVALMSGFELPTWTLAFIVGYLSHLGANALTSSGVPLLWPWRRRVRLANIRTGSMTEYAVVAGLTGLWMLAMVAGTLPFVVTSPALRAAPETLATIRAALGG